MAILRIDARINFLFGSTPTGNLFGQLGSAQLVGGGAIGSGARPVPFKSASDVVFPGRLVVDKVTSPAADSTLFDFSVTAPGTTGVSAPYSSAFLLADQTTPWASGDVDPSKGILNGALNNIAGLYTIAEASVPGWTTSVNCTGGGQTVTKPNSRTAVIDLRENELVTCTFTNIRDTTLTLVKTVTNDNGGTALPSAWTLSAAGPTPISGTTGTPAVTAQSSPRALTP